MFAMGMALAEPTWRLGGGMNGNYVTSARWSDKRIEIWRRMKTTYARQEQTEIHSATALDCKSRMVVAIGLREGGTCEDFARRDESPPLDIKYLIIYNDV